ncbi:MAG: sodium:calcium antiporter [Candidatus Nanoarchaeia archaeon]
MAITLINFLLFLSSLFALGFFGQLVVSSLVKVATFLKLKEFTAAFILIAFATTLPELFFGVFSALNGVPELSLGNVVGTVLVNLCLIGGVATLLSKNITFSEKQIRKDFWICFGIVLIPVVLLIDGVLGRLDGFILIAVFIGYLSYLISKRKKERANFKNSITKMQFVIATFLLVIGFLMIYFSAEYLVRFSELIIKELGWSEFFFSLIIIAIGTSIPELTFASVAALKGHGQMAIGDLLGAVIFDFGLILGVTAIIKPIKILFSSILIDLIFMIFAVFFFVILAQSGKKLTWTEGIALIFYYVLFLIVVFSLK